jgi:putative transposase
MQTVFHDLQVMYTQVMITRRVTFRLDPSKKQEVELHYYRRLHKDLYNACVYHRKTEYQKFSRNVTYYDQQNILPAFKQEWEEYKTLGSQALQATVKRVDFAFQRFFSGLGKYPRFKSSRYYRGWTYPATSGWKAHTTGDRGGLELTGILGQIQMRGKARTWGTPTTCTIVWKQNKWYASITVNCEPVRETGIGAIGLDIGTLTTVAMSDGTKIENPRFLATPQKQINVIAVVL